mgnify:CR=1 FL=1
MGCFQFESGDFFVDFCCAEAAFDFMAAGSCKFYRLNGDTIFRVMFAVSLLCSVTLV